MVGMINLKSRCLYTHSKDSLRIKALMTIPDTYGVDRPWHIWNWGSNEKSCFKSIQLSLSSWSSTETEKRWPQRAWIWSFRIHGDPGPITCFFSLKQSQCGWISTPWPVRLVRNSLMDMNRIFATWDGRPDPVAPEKNASKGIRTIKDRFPVPFFQVRRVLSFGGWTIGSITAGFEGSFSWRILSKTCRSRWVSVNEHFMGRWQVDMMESFYTKHHGPRVIDTYTSRIISPSWNRNPFEAMFKSHLWPQKLGPVTWPHVRWFTLLVYGL